MNWQVGSLQVEHEQRSFLCHLGFFPVSTGALFLSKRALSVWKQALYVFEKGLFPY